LKSGLDPFFACEDIEEDCAPEMLITELLFFFFFLFFPLLFATFATFAGDGSAVGSSCNEPKVTSEEIGLFFFA
jgi:hypothetical protein